MVRGRVRVMRLSAADVCLWQTLFAAESAADIVCGKRLSAAESATKSATDVCLPQSLPNSGRLPSLRQTSLRQTNLAKFGRVCGKHCLPQTLPNSSRVWQTLPSLRQRSLRRSLRQTIESAAELWFVWQTWQSRVCQVCHFLADLAESAKKFLAELAEPGRLCQVCGRAWQALPSLRQTKCLPDIIHNRVVEYTQQLKHTTAQTITKQSTHSSNNMSKLV